jgi:hypothetical protein
MQSQNNIYVAILIGIILVMGYFMIFSSPETVVEEFDDSALLEEIRLLDSTSSRWEAIADSSMNVANVEKHKSDSLENLKPSIKVYYEKKYTFNANADILQLDSVVRATW